MYARFAPSKHGDTRLLGWLLPNMMPLRRNNDQYSTALPASYQKLGDDIWEEIMRACEDYFIRGITTWASEGNAPEFTDEQVIKQVESWDAYRGDKGAMMWKHNTEKDFAYDLTKLPMQMKRVLCERAYMLAKEAGLFDNPDWIKRADSRRKAEFGE